MSNSKRVTFDSLFVNYSSVGERGGTRCWGSKLIFASIRSSLINTSSKRKRSDRTMSPSCSGALPVAAFFEATAGETSGCVGTERWRGDLNIGGWPSRVVGKGPIFSAVSLFDHLFEPGRESPLTYEVVKACSMAASLPVSCIPAAGALAMLNAAFRSA